MPRPRKEAATNAEQAETKPRAQKPKLVKMKRPDGHTADVHPDMVDEYRKGDYEVV